jgi:hypothetical protein
MKRMWPEEYNSLLDNAEEVTLDVTGSGSTDETSRLEQQRKALKVRMLQQDYERIWPLAEARYRLEGKSAGKAITLIANNPHYQRWHPVDGGTIEEKSESGNVHQSKYVIVHFLLDDVSNAA